MASCAEDQAAKDVYELYKNGVPCCLDPEEMLAKHPDIEAIVIASANDRLTVQYTCFDEWIGLIDGFVDCVRNGKQPKINLK